MYCNRSLSARFQLSSISLNVRGGGSIEKLELEQDLRKHKPLQSLCSSSDPEDLFYFHGMHFADERICFESRFHDVEL